MGRKFLWKVLANSVPAAAVIRKGQALFFLTGCKAYFDCIIRVVLISFKKIESNKYTLMLIFIYINSILGLRIKFFKIKRKTECEGIFLGKNDV